MGGGADKEIVVDSQPGGRGLNVNKNGLHALNDPQLQSTAPPPGIAIVETKNVTNFETHADGLATRRADVTFFQEHCATSSTMSRLAH